MGGLLRDVAGSVGVRPVSAGLPPAPVSFWGGGRISPEAEETDMTTQIEVVEVQEIAVADTGAGMCASMCSIFSI